MDPNANISSNTNNLNSRDSAMNLSATINQMIDDTLNSSANHRLESNPRIHHSHSEQQSFTRHHLTNEKEAEENDQMQNHPVSPEPIVRQNEPVRPPESAVRPPRRSKHLNDDDYVPGPKKTPKKVTHTF